MDVYAVSIVVSGFFFGLAVGSYYFAGIAQRSTDPRQLYSRLELATAISALFVLLLLGFGAQLYVTLEHFLGRAAWAVLWILIATPAVFMGGTFLALLRIHRQQQGLGHSVGLLYGANTSGAILGTISTPFLLIPLFGVLGSGAFAVAVNLVLAGLAIRWLPAVNPELKAAVAKAGSTSTPAIEPTNSAESIKPSQSAPRADPDSATAQSRHKIIVMYSLIGFAAIAYEVIWGQMIIQFLNTRTHAYAVMLSVYLAGLALGNFLMSRRADSLPNLWRTFAMLTITAAVTALLSIVFIHSQVIEVQRSLGDGIYQLTGQLGLKMLAQFLFISVFFILLPTCCFGALFPLAAKLADGDRGQGSLSSGYALAANTMGGVFASLLFGFWVVPAFGLVAAVVSVTVLLAAIAVVALIFAQQSRYLILFCAGVVLLAFTLPKEKFANLLLEQEGGELLYFAEGVGNTVAVIEQGQGKRKFRRLYIEGISNTGDVMASLRYMRLQSYIPLLMFDGQPRSALVIGMGTGITSGALLNYPSLENRTVIELLPEVVEATPYFQGNYDINNRPEIDVVVGDGRHQLLRDSARYDLITLEPPPPTAAGVNNLYSTDFYQLAKSRLTDKGVLAQWWPISTQSLEASRSLVQSMLDSFDYVTLWSTELHEMLLIGSMTPQTLDFDRLQKSMQYPPLAASLSEVGIDSPAALLATYMTDRQGLEAFAGNAKPVTDNDPRLEYDRWTNKRVILEVLPELLEEQEQIAGVPRAFERDYQFEQEKLYAFYYAGISTYSGDRETWAEMLKRLYRADSSNAYYNWFNPNG